MSYQIAIIIKAAEGKKLSDMIAQNRSYGETTRIGWWIPSRGENDPPEEWTFNMADIYLKTNVNETKIEMTQSIFDRGLYIEEGETVEEGFYITDIDKN